jgi:hypothetical protein
MVTTHVFVGMALAAPLAYAFPEFATPLAVGAILGGLVPDVDVLFEHRRTLHYPVAGLVGVALACSLALAVTVPGTVALAVFAVTAWLHAASDAIGAGPSLDPWQNPSDRAVYDHVRGNWLPPRRLIRYDGAPEDALVGVVLAVPGILVFDGWVEAVIGGCLVVSMGYTVVRRRIPRWFA